jgi:hypothetical protein
MLLKFSSLFRLLQSKDHKLGAFNMDAIASHVALVNNNCRLRSNAPARPAKYL